VPLDAGLRDELLAMARADRDARRDLPRVLLSDEPYPVALRDLDAVHAARLWEILDDYECWPGRRLVGDDGTEAAWMLVHHAVFDPELQRRSLEMLELAVDCDDAPARHLALLLDRVRTADGRPQLYGSQLVRADDGDGIEPWPIDDAALVDRRRAAVGLGPLDEYVRAMRERYVAFVGR
jgi:hypothetical protein